MKLLRYFRLCLLAMLMLACTVTSAMAVDENDINAAARTKDANYAVVNELVYVIAELDVRSGPGAEYDSVGTLQYGEVIQRVGLGDNGWSQVIFAGKQAFVSSDFVSTTRPTVDIGEIDKAMLQTQIAIANGLRKTEYTTQSWAVLDAALEKANQALDGNDQQAADQAMQELKEAIAALEKMDYTLLENTLMAAETFQNDDELNALRRQLEEAVAEGRDMLSNGDQAAVDASAVKIYELLVKLQTELEKREAPGTIVQQTPVQVLPTDDYCNMAGHRLWQVMFFIVLALNVCLIAVMVTFWMKRTLMLQRDDTPLVDYDIDDDAV